MYVEGGGSRKKWDGRKFSARTAFLNLHLPYPKVKVRATLAHCLTVSVSLPQLSDLPVLSTSDQVVAWKKKRNTILVSLQASAHLWARCQSGSQTDQTWRLPSRCRSSETECNYSYRDQDNWQPTRFVHPVWQNTPNVYLNTVPNVSHFKLSGY